MSELSVDALEEQIDLLCGHLNAAKCRLLELIGELDRREPWGAFGQTLRLRELTSYFDDNGMLVFRDRLRSHHVRDVSEDEAAGNNR